MDYINPLGQDLIPLAERSARVMREALAAPETLRAARSGAVERSKPISPFSSTAPVVTRYFTSKWAFRAPGAIPGLPSATHASLCFPRRCTTLSGMNERPVTR